MDCMLLENNDFAVSVIIPSFNRPDFLQEALLSALNQTIPPVEILVIDDGSDPEALSIIQSLAAIHDCIRIIALGQHLGVSHARNVGLDLAVGEWILFLDDDDILFTTFFLENCYRALSKNPDSGVIAGRALRFQSSSAVVFPRDLISGYDLLTYEKDPLHALIVNGLAVGSFMIRRESIGTTRFSEQIRYNEDILFLISVLRSGASLVVADRAIVAIRRHKFQSQSILKTHYSDDAFFDFIYPALRKIHEALLGADPFLTYFTGLLTAVAGFIGFPNTSRNNRFGLRGMSTFMSEDVCCVPASGCARDRPLRHRAVPPGLRGLARRFCSSAVSFRLRAGPVWQCVPISS